MCECYLKAEFIDWSRWSKDTCQTVSWGKSPLGKWGRKEWGRHSGQRALPGQGSEGVNQAILECLSLHSNGNKRCTRAGDARCLQRRAGFRPGGTGEPWEGREQRRDWIISGALEWAMVRLEAGRPGRRLRERTEAESSQSEFLNGSVGHLSSCFQLMFMGEVLASSSHV